MILNNNDLVSIIIPTKNRKNLLKDAIQSALDQTWQNLEIIVIDDGSTDETHDYLRNLSLIKKNIHYVRNEISQGGSSARNHGIEMAKGKYIAFLDDDDTWMREKIERQLFLLKKNSSISAVSCWFFMLKESGNKKIIKLPFFVSSQDILSKNCLGGSSMCLTTKKALRLIGGFDNTLKSGQDWDLWIKLRALGQIEIYREPLVNYFSHNGERITTNQRSLYSGLRKIYFRYFKEMSIETKKNFFYQLLYTRRVLMPNGIILKSIGFYKLAKNIGLLASARFFFRFLKHALY